MYCIYNTYIMKARAFIETVLFLLSCVALSLSLLPSPDSNNAITVLEGNDLIVTCSPSVPLDSGSSIVWSSDGLEVGNDTLELLAASQEDGKTYQCRVVSGSVIVASIDVEVIVEGKNAL